MNSFVHEDLLTNPQFKGQWGNGQTPLLCVIRSIGGLAYRVHKDDFKSLALQLFLQRDKPLWQWRSERSER